MTWTGDHHDNSDDADDNDDNDLATLVIFTVNQDIGLSAGNQLCGNLTGQHGEMPGQVVTTTLAVGHWVRVPLTATVTIHNVAQCTWTWTR